MAKLHGQIKENNLLLIDKNFWYKKKVLITGHSGFKGSWLSLWLQNMDVKVYGISLPPKQKLNLFNAAKVNEKMISYFCNICDYDLVKKYINKIKPDIIIHMAAQSLVRHSYTNPIETYSTNVIGTLNILEIARKVKSVKVVLNITSDKCYENKKRSKPYKEHEPLGGYDPYSSSKACSEILTNSYRRSFYANVGIALASARAGNVIGGGDWSDDRLIPDIIRGFKKKKNVLIRFPNSIRPWQHVLDPLLGYILLAEKLYKKGPSFTGAWNFGPDQGDAKTVKWITQRMSDLWGGTPKWKIDKKNNFHEEKYLELNCSKAKKYLNWKPKLKIDDSLKMVVEWYRAFLSKKNMKSFTIRQIENFIERDST
jgi:CDP-glucose 4,6-dehydratase